jgi:hypothetical protein
MWYELLESATIASRHVGECLFPRLSVRNHFLIAGTQHRFSLAGREIIGTGVHVLDVEVPDVLI